MALFLREERVAVGDDQAEIARAGLVDAGKINLVENSVAEREPDAAVQIERCAHAGLGARSPARFDSRPARRVTNFISQWSSPAFSSLPEDADFRCWRYATTFMNASNGIPCRHPSPQKPDSHRIVIMRGLPVAWVRFRVVNHASLIPYSSRADVPRPRPQRRLSPPLRSRFRRRPKGFPGLGKAQSRESHGPGQRGRRHSRFPSSIGSGVLEAQFYENDSIFASRKKYDADPARARAFRGTVEPRRRVSPARASAAIPTTVTLFSP